MLTHNEVGMPGLVFALVHVELIDSSKAADSGEGAILPTWTAVDDNNVKTSRELWEHMTTQGWNVDVRICVFVWQPFSFSSLSILQYHRLATSLSLWSCL